MLLDLWEIAVSQDARVCPEWRESRDLLDATPSAQTDARDRLVTKVARDTPDMKVPLVKMEDLV